MARARVAIGLAVAVLGVLTGCSESPERREERELERAVARLEDRADAVTHAVDDASGRVASLEEKTRGVVQSFAAAGAAFDAAELATNSAARSSLKAAGENRETVEQFERVAQNYRIAAYSVISLAVTAAAAQAVCSTRMSTSEFRAKNGITSPDIHVDHIWPRARGGIDSPLNYQPLDAHTNMSCGAGCLGAKAASAPLSFAVAVAASVLGRLGCP